jgi:GT2 family glycosyltransferase
MIPNCSCLIVIVNYRTAKLVMDCLRSLEPELANEPACRVAVVDNQSGDGSIEQIQAAIREQRWTWATAISAGKNAGFAAGNNVAIRSALESDHAPSYFLLLNPDTYIRPQAVTALLDFMQAHPNVGIAGSRLEYPDGTPQSAAFRFHGIWSELDRGLRLGIVTKLLKRYIVAPPPTDHLGPTDWVCGASMMVRREVFESIGLLDEGYFLYYEETDFCIRARRAGWSIWHVPASRVVHLEGQSTGLLGSGRSAKPVPRYWFTSRRRYFRKHHGAGYEFVVNLTHSLANALWRVRRKIQGKPDQDPPGYLRDFLKYALLG